MAKKNNVGYTNLLKTQSWPHCKLACNKNRFVQHMLQHRPFLSRMGVFLSRLFLNFHTVLHLLLVFVCFYFISLCVVYFC